MGVVVVVGSRSQPWLPVPVALPSRSSWVPGVGAVLPPLHQGTMESMVALATHPRSGHLSHLLRAVEARVHSDRLGSEPGAQVARAEWAPWAMVAPAVSELGMIPVLVAVGVPLSQEEAGVVVGMVLVQPEEVAGRGREAQPEVGLGEMRRQPATPSVAVVVEAPTALPVLVPLGAQVAPGAVQVEAPVARSVVLAQAGMAGLGSW